MVCGRFTNAMGSIPQGHKKGFQNLWITPITIASRPSRHRPLQRITASRDKDFEEFRDAEKDPRYRRIDMSEEHAAESRAAFLSAISAGEGSIELAEAALHVAAEDDALVSHSSVRLPVAAFRTRLQRLTDELARVRLPPLRESGANEDQILAEILKYLYEEQKYSPPSFGRSNVPSTAIVDNPGVWENARYAYLHDVLVTRRGTPAALAILLSDVLRRLLAVGAIDFAAKVEFNSEMMLAPTAKVAITNCSNIALNTCTSDALVECLSYLKRAYWPFPWDPKAGGFRGAARAFLDGADSAEAEAIARTARHRLERGIWTSPGGGDLRRAIASAERLVILRGDSAPEERRDLGVLYCHAGYLREAKAELKAASLAQAATRGSSHKPLTITLSPTAGVSVSSSLDGLPDAVLEDRLLALLGHMPLGGSQAVPLSLEEAQRRLDERSREERVLPLTW